MGLEQKEKRVVKTLKTTPVKVGKVQCVVGVSAHLTSPVQTFHKVPSVVVNNIVQAKPDCAELEKNDSQLILWIPERYKKLLKRAAVADDRELGAMARVILKKWLDEKNFTTAK